MQTETQTTTQPALQTPTTTTTAPNDFTSQLTSMLQNQSGMITSNTTAMEQSINNAIANVNRSNEASKAVTTSQYNRQIADQTAANQRGITSFQEETRGYATNTAALRTMMDQADKSVKDLEQRKQELLLQGDAQAASKIGEMQIKTIEMRTNAMQKTFDNLLQIGSYSIQSSQERRATAAQSFSERSAINSIALQYGVVPKEGDTLDTITARAMPFASEKQKLELAKTRAEINKVNAEASKALRGDATTTNMDAATLQGIAEAYRLQPQLISSQLKDFATSAKVVNKAAELEANQVVEMAKELKAKGFTSEEVKAQIDSKFSSYVNQQKVNEIILSIPDIPKPTQIGLGEHLSGMAKEGLINTVGGTSKLIYDIYKTFKQ